MRTYFVLFMICATAQLAIGQDSLANKTFKELDNLSVNAFEAGDIKLSRIYSKYQIARAKEEKDSVRIAFSFYTYMLGEDVELALKYCDSSIYYTKNSNHKSHPTYGYLVKGRRLIELGRYDEAMNNLVVAYEYAKKKNNNNHISSVKQKMAMVKSYLGDYQEALNLYREDYDYTLNNDLTTFRKRNYEIAIYNLSIIFLKQRMLDSARFYSTMGLRESDFGTDRYLKFVGLNAEVDYYSNNLVSSFDSLVKYLDKYKGNSFANKLYYIGKIYNKNNNHKMAEKYFLRVDSVVIADQMPFTEVKDVYQNLAQFFKESEDDSLQIVYINKYIWADSILTKQKTEINPLMSLKFDNPRMLAEKQRLIDKAESNSKWIYIISALAFLLILLGAALYNGQVKLKRKLKILMEEGVNLEPLVNDVNSKVELKVPQNIVSDIREKLEEFEKSDLVNNPGLNQHMLANVIDTNSTYLSNYINHFKGKNFPSYLKELRIRIAVDRLKNEPNLLKYSIKGLASDFGFATAGAFSRAFVKHTGIKPKHFLDELDKNKKNRASFINEAL